MIPKTEGVWISKRRAADSPPVMPAWFYGTYQKTLGYTIFRVDRGFVEREWSWWMPVTESNANDPPLPPINNDMDYSLPRERELRTDFVDEGEPKRWLHRDLQWVTAMAEAAIWSGLSGEQIAVPLRPNRELFTKMFEAILERIKK